MDWVRRRRRSIALRKKIKKNSLKGERWVEPGFHRGSFGGMEALGDLVGLVAWD